MKCGMIGGFWDDDGNVKTDVVIKDGMENAKKAGKERDGKTFVKNNYTGRDLRVDVKSIRHGLGRDWKRALTNARLGAVIGDIVQRAIPINAITNEADVDGTYAMAGYANDSQGREFIGIVTVEQRTGDVDGVEVYDVTHAVNGRQKRSSPAATKAQGVNPSTTTSTISIKVLLDRVNSTHQSILSNDDSARSSKITDPYGILLKY